MTSQEHLNEIAESCSSRADSLRRISWQDWSPAHDALTVETFDEARCRDVVAGLARTRTAHVPTLTHRAKLRLGDDWAPLLEDPRLEWVPKVRREDWLQYGRRQEQEIRASGMGPVNVTRFERALWLTAALHRAGITLMTGTDLGNPFVFPGSSVHDEIALLVEAGLSPMEALLAGTSVPAHFAGAADSLGTIEAGKLADLVLLRANPLEDIAAVRRIAGVVLNGRYFDSAQIAELLSGTRLAAQPAAVQPEKTGGVAAEDVALLLLRQERGGLDRFDFPPPGDSPRHGRSSRQT